MSTELTKEKIEGTAYEMLRNLIVMVAEGRCTIEEARTELETNPSEFMEKLKKACDFTK